MLLLSTWHGPDILQHGSKKSPRIIRIYCWCNCDLINLLFHSCQYNIINPLGNVKYTCVNVTYLYIKWYLICKSVKRFITPNDPVFNTLRPGQYGRYFEQNDILYILPKFSPIFNSSALLPVIAWHRHDTWNIDEQVLLFDLLRTMLTL